MTVQYPSTRDWVHATDRQKKRAERSFKTLKRRQVPVYPGPLVVEDDATVHLQSPQDVARRLFILAALDMRAENYPASEYLDLMHNHELWEFATPTEVTFLEAEGVDFDLAQSYVWQIESMWVLLWALGLIRKLDWPADTCNVETFVYKLFPNFEKRSFVKNARLRSAAAILDELDLILRIHWAIRDASLHHGGEIPESLDWAQDTARVPIEDSRAAGVVYRRHHALNWLTNFLAPRDWEHVDTPT